MDNVELCAFELVIQEYNEKSDSEISGIFRGFFNFSPELDITLKLHIHIQMKLE